jgi:DNA end-binding protein Ku
MPRGLWKGAISFGLVHVPVELYSVEKRNDLDLTMLDRRNLAPVGYKRVNKVTGDEVPWPEIVKGYEYQDGRYVVLSEEDFRRANVEATKTVDILGFVEAEKIPAVYFDTPYYLAPGKRGEKAFALLRETLKRAGKIGVATVVIRTKQYLSALVPHGDIMVLNTLRYADEIRPVEELGLQTHALKDAKVTAKELDMALRLVEDMSEDWEPERYRDTYREDILKRVEEKIQAGETEVITEPEKGEERAAAGGADVIDLMALLKKSVEKKAKAKEEKPKEEKEKPASRRTGRKRRAA